MTNQTVSPKLQAQQDARPLGSFRLNPDAFAALKKRLPRPGCPSTDLEAGYLLGIQATLELLRDGFTIE